MKFGTKKPEISFCYTF